MHVALHRFCKPHAVKRMIVLGHEAFRRPSAADDNPRAALQVHDQVSRARAVSRHDPPGLWQSMRVSQVIMHGDRGRQRERERERGHFGSSWEPTP